MSSRFARKDRGARPGIRRTLFLPLLLCLALTALAAPATSSATFSYSQTGEPPVTNTATNSFFFTYNAASFASRYCITVYRGSTSYNRGCVPSPSTYYAQGSTGTFSQTENALPDGTLVATYPSEYLNGVGLYPCSYDICHSATLIDRNKPVLAVYAAGTANYTNNPQIPLHIDYSDALSHPWFGAGGGDNAAVFICQRRDRPCTNADVHDYTPNCSHAAYSRLASPGTAKVNAFDCTYDFTSQPDGPVYLCASAADQSIPDPDPNANESAAIFPTHINQLINPATNQGWTAGSANLADSSCGSVVLDRAAPTLTLTASDTTPGTGDLVTFSASATDAVSGVTGAYSWDFGDNTPVKTGANMTHTYGSPGTYRVQLTGQDGAGNTGTASVDVVVKTVNGTGGEGTVVNKPPSGGEIGGPEGTQKLGVGQLSVVAPKKHRVAKKPTPILLALTATAPGAFQAALTKGPKVVAKGAGTLPKAGTYGFKLKLPKGLGTGSYKLKITFVPDGATTGATKSVSIKFFRKGKRHGGKRLDLSAETPIPTDVRVDAGPGLAAGYGN